MLAPRVRAAIALALGAPLLAGCAELYELRDRTEAQEREIARLHQELEEWRRSYQELLDQRQRELLARNERIEELQTEVTRLQTRQSERERELEANAQLLLQQLEAAQLALATREAEATDLRTRAEQLNSALRQAEGERQQLLAQMQEIESTLAGLGAVPGQTRAGSTGEALRETLGRLQTALDERERTIAELQSNIAQIEATGGVYPEAELERIATYLGNIAQDLEGPKPRVERDPRRGVILIFASDDIFEPGSTVVTAAARRSLATLGLGIQQLPETSVRVVGHTDNQPIRNLPFRDNWQLSASRAENVMRVLLEDGQVPAERVRFEGAGESQPLQPNRTAEGRAANRRVEIILTPDRQAD